MDPMKIIAKYYQPKTLAFDVLVRHSRMVKQKALELALNIPDLNSDVIFLEEASMLHDIGIFLTEEPRIGCFGHEEYVCHGYLGRQLLEKEGLPMHALVCERHVGVGLSRLEIEEQNIPLPMRDMVPLSIEEKIICYADKFFSKKVNSLDTEKTLDEVRRDIGKYGHEKLIMFDEMTALFNR